jgi:hypothetical protein
MLQWNFFTEDILPNDYGEKGGGGVCEILELLQWKSSPLKRFSLIMVREEIPHFVRF